MKYTVRYVHKISPNPKDIGPEVELSAADIVDCRALGAALRDRAALTPGGRVREFRIEQDGRVVAFPTVPGLTTYWHSIILTPVATS